MQTGSPWNVLWQDLWVHLAALIAVAIGLVAWSQSGFGKDPTSLELMFIIGGLAGFGLKIVNGGAAMLRAAIVAQQVAAEQGIQPPAAVIVVPAPVPPASTAQPPPAVPYTAPTGPPRPPAEP